MIKRYNKTKKTYYILLCSIAIASLLVVSLFSTLAASIQIPDTDATIQTGKLMPAESIFAPVTEIAGSESQFNVDIAYAYVDFPPSDKISYYDSRYNATMVLATKYPSAIFLNATRISGNQIGSCDAVIQVYGIKVSTDTGLSEYHAWSAGTNYTAFTQSERMILLQYSDNLIDSNRYSSPRGTFNFKWADNTSLISHTIGSVGTYTNQRPNINDAGLSSEGMPNSITVTVYRLGYVTMSNGSVTIYKDTITVDKPIADVMLSKYESGFIYNSIVPSEQLPQIDLFHPLS